MDWRGVFLPRINMPNRLRESLSPPHEEDVERLAELRDQGSRLNLPHPVRGYLVFETEGPARQAAEQLEKESYACAVRTAPDGTWVTTAVTRLVPTPGAIAHLRDQLGAVSAAHGGTYRGWDAPPVY
jgi:hypothetical protein